LVGCEAGGKLAEMTFLRRQPRSIAGQGFQGLFVSEHRCEIQEKDLTLANGL
jgi:hypothetical protein